jgi:PAS domain S-box-containing protein
MAKPNIVPTGAEVHFSPDEVIVSKTDLRGAITYANDVFRRVSGYTEDELIGQPHNLIRHPDMPACVFKLLWDTLRARHEVFAYVLNLAKDGSAYWVFAHVTPSFNADGVVVGYHSSRRVPYADAVPKVTALYAQLRAEELRHEDRAAGLSASTAMLVESLRQAGVTYDQFVFSLSEQTRLGAVA